MTNALLDHYLKNNISPVRQNINDINTHIMRRRLLYQSLGLSAQTFIGSSVLEVGPGGGYNSIATATFCPASYTLIEPNKTGFDELREKMEPFSHKTSVTLYNDTLENFSQTQKFDIVLCEGVISGIKNRETLLDRLMHYVKSDGILVITCQDEVSTLFEIFRYYFAQKIINITDSFEQKLDKFEQAYSSHLNRLIHRTRFIRDWCADCLMGEGLLNQDFSILNAIDHFKNEAFLYHVSPNFFADRRWYKSFPTNSEAYNHSIKENILSEYHNLLHYEYEGNRRESQKNNALRNLCNTVLITLRKYASHQINQYDANEKMKQLIDAIISNLNGDVNIVIIESLREIEKLLDKKTISIDDLASGCPHFEGAFGHGQQYVSFIKN